MDQKKQVGKQGEDLAVKYLKSRGYGIIRRNFRTRTGEIDVIACKRQVIYFYEIKARRSISRGWPVESVSAYKISRIKRTAQAFLSLSGISGYRALSVGIISIIYDQNNRKAHIKCIPNVDL